MPENTDLVHPARYLTIVLNEHGGNHPTITSQILYTPPRALKPHIHMGNTRIRASGFNLPYNVAL